MRNIITIIALLGISMLAACGPADQSTGTGDLADSVTILSKEAAKAFLKPERNSASATLQGTLTASGSEFKIVFDKPFADTYRGEVTRLSDNAVAFCEVNVVYGDKVVLYADYVTGKCKESSRTNVPTPDGGPKPDTTKPDAGPGTDTLKPDSTVKPDSNGHLGGIHAICKDTAGNLLNNCQFSAGGSHTCSTGSNSNDCWIGYLVPGVFQLVGSKTGFETSKPVSVTVVADQDTDAVVALSPLTDGGVTPDSGPKPDSGPVPTTGTLKSACSGLKVLVGQEKLNLLSGCPFYLTDASGKVLEVFSTADSKLNCAVSVTDSLKADLTNNCHDKLIGKTSGCAYTKVTHPKATNCLWSTILVDQAGSPASCPAKTTCP